MRPPQRNRTASVPKILRLHIGLGELLVDIGKTDKIFSVKLPVIYADRNH